MRLALKSWFVKGFREAWLCQNLKCTSLAHPFGRIQPSKASGMIGCLLCTRESFMEKWSANSLIVPMGHVLNPKHQSNQNVPEAYNWAWQMGHGSKIQTIAHTCAHHTLLGSPAPPNSRKKKGSRHSGNRDPRPFLRRTLNTRKFTWLVQLPKVPI